jgi:hypothetical protein
MQVDLLSGKTNAQLRICVFYLFAIFSTMIIEPFKDGLSLCRRTSGIPQTVEKIKFHKFSILRVAWQRFSST